MSAATDAMRGSLRNPAIRRLQLAFAGSAIGYWAAGTAVTVFSFQAAGAAGVSLQIVLRMVPAALAAPVLTTLVDRYSRVRVMVTADLVRVLIAILMGLLVIWHAPYWFVLVGSGLSGIAATVFEPAKSAILPSLAERPEELTAANVLSSSIDSVSFFAGPALAGLLLAVSNTETVLFATAATFLWSAALVSRIREPRREAAGEEEEGAAPAGVIAQMAEGLATVRDDAAIRLMLLFFAAQTITCGALTVLTAAVALDLLDLGDSGLGLLNSAMGIGGLIGVAATATLAGKRRLAPALVLGMVLWGIPLVALGLVPSTVVGVATLVVVGVANTLVDVTGLTLLQRTAPEAVIGRVFGLLETLILASIAVGSIAAAALLNVAGVEGALIAVGAFLPVLVALRWRALLGLDARAISAEDVTLLRKVDVFAGLGPVELERLAEALEPVRVAAGDAVIRQGEEGDRFYVIVAGTVDVAVDGETVGEEGAGDYFGEIALLNDSPRTATVTARDAVELRALRRDDFLGTVTGHTGSAAAVEAAASRRLATARPIAVAG